MNAKWLSKKMEKIVRENPHMKVMDIRDNVSRKWNVCISRNTVFIAKAIARDDVDGSFTEQYRRIYDYAHELLRGNLGSTLKVKVENIDGEVIFSRFYACLKACKYSFAACRPIIGVDGCFLKGKYGRELLTTVGRYVNDQILSIVYAVVEFENNDSWKWFLELLIDYLGRDAVGASCTFKGIFIKILAPSHNPTLLDDFPLYWTRFPTPQTARQMEDLNLVERKSCETLEGLEVIFDICKILELECREVDLKLFIGIIF